MRQIGILGAFLFSLGIAAFAQTAGIPSAETTITLDAKDSGKIFEGLGAVSAGASSRLLIDYPEPQRSQILDYLFKPGYGASLQHLKIEIGSDVNSTDGSEPSHQRTREDRNYTRGYEWWLMEEAKKRNPKILLDVLPWGAPGWVGSGNLYSKDMAEYVADFIQGAEREHHLAIDYVGIWNERLFDAAYVKELRSTLDRRGLKTQIVCCDSYHGMPFGEWGIIAALEKDPELRKAVSVVGVHYPWERPELPTPQEARKLGIPLWSSEDQPNGGAGPYLSREWSVGGRILAKRYNTNYVDHGLTKTEIWSPITSYYDLLAAPNSGLMYANTPWSGHYEVQSTIWVTAHTTQFVQPGWQYLDSASGRLSAGGSYVTLISTDRKNWSSVIETVDAKAAQDLRFVLKQGLASGVVHVWMTNAQHTFEKIADVTLKNGEFHYRFEPDALYTITTTAGQERGAATPPPPAKFPLPYAEDFEGTAVGRSPRYLADQDGAFEAQACKGREGRCLEQAITQRPIPWLPLPEPFTLAGDAEQKNYGLSVDVRIPRFGHATVMGRVDSADVFQDGGALYPSGYILRLAYDGHWELLSTAYKKSARVLASGVLPEWGEKWHSVALRFAGDKIQAYLDGSLLADAYDDWHRNGMFALGSDWSQVQFDNLKVVEQELR